MLFRSLAVSLGESISLSPAVLQLTSDEVVVLLAVVGAVIFVKLRQRRKRNGRSRKAYARASAQLGMTPEQPYDRVWRGPYASRASYTRSPSPVSRALCLHDGLPLIAGLAFPSTSF